MKFYSPFYQWRKFHTAYKEYWSYGICIGPIAFFITIRGLARRTEEKSNQNETGGT